MTVDQLIPIIVALVSAGGLWGYLSTRAKHQYDTNRADTESRAQFQETLKEQVERLSQKLDKVLEDKEQLLREVSELKASLARAEATIQHLEQRLMTR